ncbi:reverse transcriptase domain-containing protein [Bacillus pseudomycoides]|uniref:reverse transcriptase domain-containing protein n=1 Tax=Bacillus pseudomycoides TaxID=64104 RepID=UPI001F0B1967|nr:reverse transcriptase domain-containing protein [Bacillus pseudomycoides]MED1477501.1 reverse transcriptase domain-containing protein [Bacillus pseudomycoides]MED1538489.1 reverse transcriptase domain-containing protein [Bacillus pseudomycoides]
MKRNRGSGEVNGQIIEEIVYQYGERNFLKELYKELKSKSYHPQAVRRTYIPKGDGKQRPLGILTIKDRVIQMATKLVIEPIFEADFQECSYGSRLKLNADQAISKIRKVSKTSHWIVGVDIQGYFDNINHDKLMMLVERRLSDRRVLKLI